MLVVSHIYLLNHECLVHLSPSFPFYLVWNMYALLVFISLQHSSNAILISNTQFHLVSFLFLNLIFYSKCRKFLKYSNSTCYKF